MPDSSPMVTPAQRKWLPWLTAVGFFMQTLDGTILNTALPSMAEALGECVAAAIAARLGEWLAAGAEDHAAGGDRAGRRGGLKEAVDMLHRLDAGRMHEHRPGSFRFPH